MIDIIYFILLGISLISSFVTNSGPALSGAVLEGARAGIRLGITLSGPLLLFSGLGKLMDQAGITDLLARTTRPFLHRVFPEAKKDPALSRDLSANFCANLLGLSNAATPRGIQAAKRLKQGSIATDSLCRLVVLNTASIQLIPTSVAAIRSGLHCSTPFDILPAVLVTSFCSAGLGLTAAWIFGKLWSHD